jgi:transcriptional regulator with XRE-family HTH domain
MSIAITFGRACRDMRQRLDISQAQLAATVGLSRGYIARIETGAANPTVHQLERIAAAVGLDVALMTTPPVFLSERPRQDLVHARCSMYADRRLSAQGWVVAREVEVSDGHIHAWVDLLAFDPRTGVLLIIEIKTRLDDLGGLERQLGWYERHAARAATGLGWRPRTIGTWLLGLASAEVDGACRANRHVFDTSFPGRAPDMLAVSRGAAAPARRSIALIDPTSRRADWLIRTRLDGRRGPAPFDGYADAVRRMKR